MPPPVVCPLQDYPSGALVPATKNVTGNRFADSTASSVFVLRNVARSISLMALLDEPTMRPFCVSD
jgi:hypothetical protein